MIEDIHVILDNFKRIKKNVENMVQEIMDNPKIPVAIKVDILLESGFGELGVIPLSKDMENYCADNGLFEISDILKQTAIETDPDIVDSLYNILENMLEFKIIELE